MCVLLFIVTSIIAFVFIHANITCAYPHARERTLLTQYDITPEIGLARLAALLLIYDHILYVIVFCTMGYASAPA